MKLALVYLLKRTIINYAVSTSEPLPRPITYPVTLIYRFTSKGNNGFACLVIFRDLPENPEGTNLALDVICLKHVDEEVQSPRVPDGQLGGQRFFPR